MFFTRFPSTTWILSDCVSHDSVHSVWTACDWIKSHFQQLFFSKEKLKLLLFFKQRRKISGFFFLLASILWYSLSEFYKSVFVAKDVIIFIYIHLFISLKFFMCSELKVTSVCVGCFRWNTSSLFYSATQSQKMFLLLNLTYNLSWNNSL